MWRPKFTAAWTPREWAEFWLTSFIGFFTFVNAVAAVAYYCTYKQSAAEASRQTKQLICAANTQAQAAQSMSSAAATQATKMTELAGQAVEQAKAAHQTAAEAKNANDRAVTALHIVERPWIGVVEVNGEIQLGIETNLGSNFKIRYLNSGKAPGIETRWVVQYACEVIGVRPKIGYSEKDAVERGSAFILPGQEFFWTSDNVKSICSPTTAPLVLENKALVYAIGTVWYSDPYKLPHRTDFCFQLGIRDKAWNPCRFHNEAN